MVFCCIALVGFAILYYIALWIRQLCSGPQKDLSVSSLPVPPRALTGNGALPVYGHTRFFQDKAGDFALEFDPNQLEWKWFGFCSGGGGSDRSATTATRGDEEDGGTCTALAMVGGVESNYSSWNRPLGECFALFLWGEWRVVIKGPTNAARIMESQTLEDSWPWTPPVTLLGRSCFGFLTQSERQDLRRLIGRCLSHYPLLVQLYAPLFGILAEKCLQEMVSAHLHHQHSTSNRSIAPKTTTSTTNESSPCLPIQSQLDQPEASKRWKQERPLRQRRELQLQEQEGEQNRRWNMNKAPHERHHTTEEQQQKQQQPQRNTKRPRREKLHPIVSDDDDDPDIYFNDEGSDLFSVNEIGDSSSLSEGEEDSDDEKEVQTQRSPRRRRRRIRTWRDRLCTDSQGSALVHDRQGRRTRASLSPPPRLGGRRRNSLMGRRQSRSVSPTPPTYPPPEYSTPQRPSLSGLLTASSAWLNRNQTNPYPHLGGGGGVRESSDDGDDDYDDELEHDHAYYFDNNNDNCNNHNLPVHPKDPLFLPPPPTTTPPAATFATRTTASGPMHVTSNKNQSSIRSNHSNHETPGNGGDPIYKLKWMTLRSYTLDLMDGPILSLNQWLPADYCYPPPPPPPPPPSQQPPTSSTTIAAEVAPEGYPTSVALDKAKKKEEKKDNSSSVSVSREDGHCPSTLNRDTMLLWMERMKNGIDVIKTTFGPEWMYIWMMNEYGRALNARSHLEEIVQRHVAYLAQRKVPNVRHRMGHPQHDVTTHAVPLWAMCMNRLRQAEGLWGKAHVEPQFDDNHHRHRHYNNGEPQEDHHQKRQRRRRRQEEQEGEGQARTNQLRRSFSAPNVYYNSSKDKYEMVAAMGSTHVKGNENENMKRLRQTAFYQLPQLELAPKVQATIMTRNPPNAIPHVFLPKRPIHDNHNNIAGPLDSDNLSYDERANQDHDEDNGNKESDDDDDDDKYEDEYDDPERQWQRSSLEDDDDDDVHDLRSIASAPLPVTRPMCIIHHDEDEGNDCEVPSSPTKTEKHSSPICCHWNSVLANKNKKGDPANNASLPLPPLTKLPSPTPQTTSPAVSSLLQEEGEDIEQNSIDLLDNNYSMLNKHSPVESPLTDRPSFHNDDEDPQWSHHNTNMQYGSRNQFATNYHGPNPDTTSTESETANHKEAPVTTNARNRANSMDTASALKTPLSIRTTSTSTATTTTTDKSSSSSIGNTSAAVGNGEKGHHHKVQKEKNTCELDDLRIRLDRPVPSSSSLLDPPVNVVPLLERILRQHDLAGNGISQVVATELSLLIWMMMDAGNAYTAMALSLLSTDREACALVQQELDSLLVEHCHGRGSSPKNNENDPNPPSPHSNPLYTDRVLNKMKYMDALIYEAIRLCPANLGGMKKTTQTIEMVEEKVQIPKGTHIFFCNPTNPNTFDLKRALGKKPQDLGPQYPCVELHGFLPLHGLEVPLLVLQTKIFLVAVLQKFTPSLSTRQSFIRRVGAKVRKSISIRSNNNNQKKTPSTLTEADFSMMDLSVFNNYDNNNNNNNNSNNNNNAGNEGSGCNRPLGLNDENPTLSRSLFQSEDLESGSPNQPLPFESKDISCSEAMTMFTKTPFPEPRRVIHLQPRNVE